MPDSYLEKCIQSLPPEKQPAAREAFKAISESGDDNLISKLLVTLEATSAYAATIPQSVTQIGEHLVKDLNEILAKIVKEISEQESAREERLRKMLADLVPLLGKSLSMDKVCAGLQAQTAEMGRMERSLVRMRQVRVGGLLVFGLVGVILGAAALGAVKWHSYREGQKAAAFVERLEGAGIYTKIRDTEAGQMFTVEGPEVVSGTWRKNTGGHTNGVDIVFANPVSQ
jgi:hypothetical protein